MADRSWIPPHVLIGLVGVQLVAPSADWRRHPDMDIELLEPDSAAFRYLT
ncbi:hypothetical protein HNP40_004034 [Mycobacteroides chelonae]|nr:hypothetical protein [Mycobacteroides chelonae]